MAAPHCATLLAVLLISPAVLAQGAASRADPAGVRGALLIHGGGGVADAVRDRFVELAGGEPARIVVIPTASASADRDGAADSFLAPWRPRTVAATTLLHTRDRAAADTVEFTAPLRAASGVWISGGDQGRLSETYAGTRVERELQALLARGGVVGGTSAGAAILCRTMIAGGNPGPRIGTGFDLLPLSIVDQHFVARDRQPRLLAALAQHPGHFGLGVDERTAVEIRGRTLRVLGESVAVLALAEGAGRPARVETLKPGDRADLCTWQRCALGRAGAPFPPPEPVPPVVASGTVFLAGGGRLPRELLARFLEAAGGNDAPIAVVPTAAGPDAGDGPGLERTLRQAGATNVRTFHAAHPDEVAGAENLEFLQQARGVWFGGGRQWRLYDAYAGTAAEAAFHAVLARGGAIGGSSAGCSIQAQFMVRGNPLGNRQIAFEGYEQGFGFLPGCGVDQHFFRRGREQDLEELVRRYPQVLGIGVDEGAAIVVTGSTMEVLGGKVAVYDRRGLEPDAETRKAVHEPGAQVELKMRDR